MLDKKDRLLVEGSSTLRNTNHTIHAIIGQYNGKTNILTYDKDKAKADKWMNDFAKNQINDKVKPNNNTIMLDDKNPYNKIYESPVNINDKTYDAIEDDDNKEKEISLMRYPMGQNYSLIVNDGAKGDDLTQEYKDTTGDPRNKEEAMMINANITSKKSVIENVRDTSHSQDVSFDKDKGEFIKPTFNDNVLNLSDGLKNLSSESNLNNGMNK